MRVVDNKEDNPLQIILAAFWVAMVFVAIALIGCGCATKSRNVEMQGMYASETGVLAIGSLEVMASPEGEETAIIKYAEDTAWLSPSTKTHAVKVMLTGKKSAQNACLIVKDICNAFVETQKPLEK